MSKSIAYKHQLRALSRWPKDPLRPEVQFQDFIRKRIDRRLDVKRDDQRRSQDPPSALVWNEESELEQANALYSLVEGRYSRKYPLANLLKPASNPTHYIDLIKELEEAPTRSWFSRVKNRWKGFLRFK